MATAEPTTTGWHPATREEILEGAARIRDCFKENRDTPFFVGRNGTIETEALYFWLVARRGSGELRDYPARIAEQLQRNAGVFPNDNESIDRWCEAYATAMGLLTGTAAAWYKPLWFVEQNILSTFAPPTAFRTPLRSLEPYYQPPEFRWTPHLAGKKVALVSSFTFSMQRQIWGEKLDSIWTGEQRGVLSNALSSQVDWSFIRTGYSPTLALGRCEWPDKSITRWEHAVDYVVDKVIRSGAEIAIIGCGGLGMVIGGRLRAAGISAFVMGGAIQVLFGIKGKRWATHDVISKFWNNSWIWPDKDETPLGAFFVESGCYWG